MSSGIQISGNGKSGDERSGNEKSGNEKPGNVRLFGIQKVFGNKSSSGITKVCRQKVWRRKFIRHTKGLA
jgi:hypothetical protein